MISFSYMFSVNPVKKTSSVRKLSETHTQMYAHFVVVA